MNYFEVIENNDWEGEQWTFFIEEEGNQEFIEKLRNAIKKFNIDPDNFEVKDELTSNDEVYRLVKRGKSRDYGYMPAFNKIAKKLDPNTIDDSSEDAFVNSYYKGKLFE